MCDLPSCSLVDPSVTQVQDVTLDADANILVLTLESTPTTATCPLCSHPAQRIHSRYQHTLVDVAWAELHRPCLPPLPAAHHEPCRVEVEIPPLDISRTAAPHGSWGETDHRVASVEKFRQANTVWGRNTDSLAPA